MRFSSAPQSIRETLKEDFCTRVSIRLYCYPAQFGLSTGAMRGVRYWPPFTSDRNQYLRLKERV